LVWGAEHEFYIFSSKEGRILIIFSKLMPMLWRIQVLDFEMWKEYI
jgi:hypothetical protein